MASDDLLSELQSLADPVEAAQRDDTPTPANPIVAEESTRHTIRRAEDDHASRTESAAGVLGNFNTLNPQEKADWIKGEIAAAQSSQSFWAGMRDKAVTPFVDFASGFNDLNRQQTGEADPIMSGVSDWVKGRVERNIADAKRREFLAREIEAGHRPGPTQGTVANAINQTMTGLGDTGIANMVGGAGRLGSIVDDALYGSGGGSLAGAYGRLVDATRSPAPNPPGKNNLVNEIADAALQASRNNSTGIGRNIELTSRASHIFLRHAGEWISAKTKQWFPTDEARQEEFASKLANGAGSMLAFMGPAMAASILTRGGPRTLAALMEGGMTEGEAVALMQRQAGVAGMTTSAYLGAPMEAESMAQDAEKAQARGQKKADGTAITDADIKKSFLWGLPIGATEALPMENLFFGHGSLMRRVLTEAGQEGGQEFIQSVLENFVAQHYYDPDRHWDEGAWEAGAIGAILGAHTQGIHEGIDRLSGRAHREDDEPEPVKLAKLQLSGKRVISDVGEDATAPPSDDRLEFAGMVDKAEKGAKAGKGKKRLGTGLDGLLNVPDGSGKAVDKVAGAVPTLPPELADFIRQNNPELAKRYGLDQEKAADGEQTGGEAGPETKKPEPFNPYKPNLFVDFVKARRAGEDPAAAVAGVLSGITDPLQLQEIADKQHLGLDVTAMEPTAAYAAMAAATEQRVLNRYSAASDGVESMPHSVARDAAVAEQPRVEKEQAPADQMAAPDRDLPQPTDNVSRATQDANAISEGHKSAFRRVLAGNVPPRLFGKALDVTPGQLDALQKWAVGEGLLRLNKKGQVARTPKAKAAAVTAGGEVGNRQGRTERPGPVGYGLAIPPGYRAIKRAESVERATGERMPEVAKDYAAMLESAGTDPGAFESVVTGMLKDRSVTKPVLDQIAAAYTGDSRKSKTKKDAYDRIARLFKERMDGAADAERGDVRGNAREVPLGEQAGDVRQDEGGRDAERALQGEGPGGAIDVRGHRGADGDGQDVADGIRGAGEGARSDSARRGGDSAERSRIERVVAETRAKAEQERLDRSRRNYRITDEDEIGKGGPKAKIRANIEAIRILRQIEDEGGREATEDEKRSLVRFTGWGAFAQDMFLEHKPEFARERQQFRDLVSTDEYEAARRSTQNAHYTSPEVVRGMWAALGHLGFSGGRVIEPSAGIGHFIGMMPAALLPSVDWTAVELDKITGGILKALYGATDVRVTGFQDVNWPDGFFDLAVSNVPFGKIPIRDTRYKSTYNVHDYFFVKALDKVRPGGIVAFVTSRYTMDKQGAEVRRAIDKRASLLGAIRLPGGRDGAFAGNAGTDVTTDIIFLRKRMDGEPADTGHSWLDLKEIDTPDGPTKINAYFADNPEMMLGKMRLQGTMYGSAEPILVGSSSGIEGKIVEAAKNMPEGAFIARGEPLREQADAAVDSETDGIKEGAFYVKIGTLYRKVVGVGQPQKVGIADQKRIESFIGLRDLVNDILALQACGKTDALPHLRAKLNKAYDAFVKKHGAINKTVRTETTRKDGKTITQRRMPNLAAFRADPDAFKVAAIENYDEEHDVASKAAIFTGDVIGSYERPSISGPEDALAASLNETGKIDMPLIAVMMGTSEEQAAEQLGELVYRNPNGDSWQTAAIYLSGDVVTKLADARAAAESDPAYSRNVSALEAVQPAPLTRDDIHAPFGAPWVPAGDYETFLRQLLGLSRYTDVPVKLNPVTKKWTIEGKLPVMASAQAEYGTDRRSVKDIVEAALNSTPIRVLDEISDGHGGTVKVLNQKATEEANAKVKALREAWSGNVESGVDGWVWGNEERAQRLEALYNDQFNRLVPIKSDGSHLTLPGLSKMVAKADGTVVPFDLRPHQKNAIWRAIVYGNTLLDHTVGAGKTYTMIAAAMEQKRLGLIQRPMVVVPNHMLEQFTRSWLRAYPNAKLLVADKDSMTKDKRREFAARIAADKWDGIIITHSAFGRIRMSDESYADFHREQIAELEEAIAEEVKTGDRKKSLTVKQLERMKESLTAKIAAMTNKERKDDGILFEELGVDQIILDEAHLFKNLQLVTRHNRIKGLATSASQRATDLFLKIRHIEKSRPGRGAIFATGTPVSNTMAEMYTMQRYLQMDALKQYGIDKFDAWAGTFGEITSQMELSTDGRNFQEVTSFSRFVNIPELVQIYSRVADTQTADMLNLPRPTLRGGSPQIVEAEPSAAEEEYMAGLIDRAEDVRKGGVDPAVDNMLKIMSEGRKVATDMRLLDEAAEINPDGKIARAVDKIAEIWRAGNADPKAPNKAQIVFLDMGVPGRKRKSVELPSAVDANAPESQIESIRKALEKEAKGATEEDDGVDDADSREGNDFFAGAFNLYDEIKRLLIELGVPTAHIAFVHDAKTDEAKAKLFAKVRAGEVRVLIGSTGKMGVGTNVQRKLVAMHHIDAPWKPAEVEQRDGRILRQGNENKEIEIYRYVTRRSLDAFMWQTLERKANFIAQLRAGAKGVRTAEDIDNPLPEAAAMKAAASGDPRILEHAELTKEIRDLEAARRAQARSAEAAKRSLAETQRKIAFTEAALAKYAADAAHVEDTKGDKFKVTLDGREVTDRKKAAEAIKAFILGVASRTWSSQGVENEIGKISGFTMTATVRRIEGGAAVKIGLAGQAQYEGSSGEFGVGPDSDMLGTIRRWENMVQDVLVLKRAAEETLAGYRGDIERLERQSQGQAFAKQAALDKAKARSAEIEAALKPQKPEGDGETPFGEAYSLAAINEDKATGRAMRADIDALGFYSGALLAALALRQAKGTPEQMLAMLKKAGAKQGEIEATGLGALLDGKKSITRDEIVSHLEGNRVGLREVQYGREPGAPETIAEIDDAARAMAEDNGLEWSELTSYARQDYRDEVMRGADTTKWSANSLDPSNPTYRETVLHLPESVDKLRDLRNSELDRIASQYGHLSNAPDAERAAFEDLSQRAYAQRPDRVDFHSGHFPEPNITGHMMTSMTKHEGKPVYTIDQIQSDWGQKLRDGGVRDEAKIAELKARMEAAKAASVAHMDTGSELLNGNINTRDPSAISGMIATIRHKATGTPERIADQAAETWIDTHARLQRDYNLALAEFRTADASVSGHPLVNTTDQWTTTTLRRALTQAVAAGAHYIAIPHGDTVLSYNPGDEHGMRGFYGSRTSEGIVPKNLRKLLEKIDKEAAKPAKIEKLETSQGQQGWQGDDGTRPVHNDWTGIDPKRFDYDQTGFTLFPITDMVKAAISVEGQPLFRIGDAPSIGSFRPGVMANREQIAADVENAIRPLLPVGAAIHVADQIMGPNGTTARGVSRVGNGEALVRLALTVNGRAQPQEAIKAIGYHETVHVIRELGGFTDEEWASLLDRADKIGIDEQITVRDEATGIDIAALPYYARAYADQAREIGLTGIAANAYVNERLNQERVAKLAESWANGSTFGKAVDALLARLVEVLRAIKAALYNNGFTRLGDVFEAGEERGMAGRLRSGEIAARINAMLDSKEMMDAADARRQGEMILSPGGQAAFEMFAIGATAIDAQKGLVSTEDLPGYGTPQFQASREFNFDGQRVVGYDAAVERLSAIADGYAGPDGPAGERKLIVLVAPPGAGKTHVGKMVALATRSAIVTSDDPKFHIPEFAGGTGSSVVHEEASLLAARVQKEKISRGHNLLVEKLGGNSASIERLVDGYSAHGYDVRVVAVGADRDVLLRRIGERAARTGRTVPIDEVDKTLRGISETLLNLKKRRDISGIMQIDNGGEMPYIIDGKDVLGHGFETALQSSTRQPRLVRGSGGSGAAEALGRDARRGRAAGAPSGTATSHQEIISATPSIPEAQPFAAAGMTGTIATQVYADDTRLHVVKLGTGADGKPRAGMAITERGGRAVVDMVKLDPSLSADAAERMYGTAERTLGVPFAPGGWLTQAGYEHWKKQDADAVRSYVSGGDVLHGMWLSPHAIDMATTVLETAGGHDENLTALRQMKRQVPAEAANDALIDELAAKSPTEEVSDALFALGGTTADLDTLQVAKDMEAAGAERASIALQTGWSKGPDGKWRFVGAIMAYRGEATATHPQESDRTSYWATSDQNIAESWAYGQASPPHVRSPNITPVSIDFNNPMVLNHSEPVHYNSVVLDGRTMNTSAAAEIARRRGHDGLIVNNVRDNAYGGGEPATTYAALRRGTVRSTTTGELLFSLGSYRGDGIKPLTQIISELKVAIGMMSTQGRYGLTVSDADGRTARFQPQAGVRGQYDRRGGVARFRIATDIEAVAHEGGHHLETMFARLRPDLDIDLNGTPTTTIEQPFDRFMRQNAADLARFAPGNAQNAESESFAEFFRAYILDPARAESEAPQLVESFGEFLDSYAPDVAEGIERVTLATSSADWQRYVNATTVERARADLTSYADQRFTTKVRDFYNAIGQETISGWAHHIYEGALDQHHPWYRAVAALLETADKNRRTDGQGRAVSLAAHDNPYKLIRSISDSFKTGLRWIQDGMPNYREFGGQRSASLHAALSLVMGRKWNLQAYQTFGVYLESRRAVEEWQRWDAKQQHLADLGTRIAQLAGMRPDAAKQAQRIGAMLERRTAAHTGNTAILKDRRRALGVAETDLRHAQERLAALNDDLREARRAIDDGSDVAKATRDRKLRSIQLAERQQRDAVREVERLRREVDEREIGSAMAGNEIDQMDAMHVAALTRLSGLDTHLRELRAELADTQQNGMQRAPHRIGQAEHEERIRQIETANPNMRRAAQMVYDFLWQSAVHDFQAGRLSRAELAYRETRRDWYVPFARDISDADASAMGPAGGALKRFAKDKRFTGSQRNVVNPLETIIDQAFHRAAATHFNDTVQALRRVAESAGPGGAAVAEMVDKREVVDAVRDEYDRIQQHLVSLGYDAHDAAEMVRRIESDFDDTQLLLAWTPEGLGPKRPIMLPVWENGERRFLRINDPEFAQSVQQTMAGIGRELSNVFVDMAAKPATMLRIGVTTHPAFIVPNILRDMWSAWIITGNVLDPRTWPVVTQARGLFHEMVQSDMARLYQEAAGIMGGQNVAALSHVRDKADIMALKDRGLHIRPVRMGAAMTAGGVAGGMLAGPGGAMFGALVGAALHRGGGPAEWYHNLVTFSDMSETATRLGTFTTAYRAALAYNPTLTPYQAAQEAAYVARDLIDFGRRGSKMMVAAKLVPFLNANLQGLDKAVRATLAESDRGRGIGGGKITTAAVAGAAAGFVAGGPTGAALGGLVAPTVAANMAARSEAVRRLLAPWYKNQAGLPMSLDEERALANSAKAWTNMLLYTLLLVGFMAVYRDDDEYRRIPDRVKFKAQPVKIFGEWFAIPKAFEWSAPSVIVEAAIDAQFKNDPRFLSRVREGLTDVLAPPAVPQAARIWADMRSNYNSQSDRPIVPDHLAKLSPEYQYTAYTSALAVWLGQQTGASPLMIDYALKASGGYWGKDAQKTSNAQRGTGPASGKVTEYPLIGTAVQRFVLDPDKQADAHKAFWDRMASDRGTFAKAAADFDWLVKNRGVNDGYAYLAKLPDDETRAYAILQEQQSGSKRRSHPLNRLADVLKINRDMQADIVMEKLVDSSSRSDPAPIKLSPAKADEVMRAMNTIAAVEAENAMIALKQEQFASRKPRPLEPALDVLRAASPDVADQYERRLRRAHVKDAGDVLSEWPSVRDELLADWREASGEKMAGMKRHKAK